MELKVWVDGVQRIVCGVTEATTCQEVVIALAQAIGFSEVVSILGHSCISIHVSPCSESPPQEKEQELEQLTKELRQVNLQQFIQQTGTKVTVLPAESTEEEPAQLENESTAQTNSLKRPSSSRQLPSNLRILQNPLSSGFNPEGIYV
ncbi:Ras association domain-containing protein 8 [Acipenser ruthenus]|uniref:Ras association domain-containing protein 8 n=1 Tax=Acipenser ruthenus TaxID=7906 RepID=A0A662YWE5_ACIRT|nr:Ras association domain-containing protein 8 [Acipenser ruthenus]